MVTEHGIQVVDGEPSLVGGDAHPIRGFKPCAQREAQLAAFYSSYAWLLRPCEATVSCIDSYYTAVLDASAQPLTPPAEL
ncbi:hypothetical protein [Amycolatopsis plumensis]|uniref:Uncharacterized protein n=1 Tax=Amycolatopsis plumensis TaxID=236508 RepID=A0ABV5UL44_9PSEU